MSTGFTMAFLLGCLIGALVTYGLCRAYWKGSKR